MKVENEALLLSDQSLRPKRTKSREVSSRFLSPATPPHDNGIQSPSHPSSPLRRKFTHTRRDQTTSESSGFMRGLWPSSSPSPSSNKKNVATLADHLRNDRLKDFMDGKKDKKSSNSKKTSVFSLGRQRSCSEFSRFEDGKEKLESAKENHRPILGGSMRYTGKLHAPGKSSTASSSSSNSSLNSSFRDSSFVPGRLSVDENALYRNSKHVNVLLKKSDSSAVNDQDSESECSEICSASSPASSKSSRQSGIDVSSKYLNVIGTRSRRWTSDSNIQNQVSLDASPKMKKFTMKNAIKRANSLTAYGSATSQWALSPGRSGSPPMSVEYKERPVSFSSMKPPSSPSRAKGVEKLLYLGLDLFKGKKSSSSSSLISGSGNVENVHRLRLLHNRLLQWRYANAKAEVVNGNLNKQEENSMLCALDNLIKLRHSVLNKKLQLQKEKLEIKLDSVLQSQIKLLEAWGEMERQHASTLSTTKECLYSVICKVPLIEGAKVDPQSASIVLRHASDVTTSIKLAITAICPSAEETVTLVSQLAEVAAQEKLLLEECFELFQTVSTLEIQERSLKCDIMQLTLRQQQLQPKGGI